MVFLDVSRLCMSPGWQKLTQTETYLLGAFHLFSPLSSYDFEIAEALTEIFLSSQSCVTWMDWVL